MNDQNHTPGAEQDRQLFYGFKPKDGDPAQFVGCYILKWPFDTLGPPDMAFTEANDASAPDMAETIKRQVVEIGELQAKIERMQAVKDVLATKSEQDQADLIERLRLAAQPFAHNDLSKILGGNVQDNESIVFQRSAAVLRLGDFRCIRAALIETEVKP